MKSLYRMKKISLQILYLLLHLTPESTMYELPDFTPYGYRLLEILSNNIQGGRITYKAIKLSTNDYVIIKQFQFASSQNWDVYKQVEREINVLEGLDHIGIPNYLETINHPDDICLVQNYINAPNLSRSRTFDAEQIKSIATQLLEILVYLQSRIPVIIHRDIKTENILYDAENDRVYLIDFGLAKIGTNDSALSSMFGGTPGFMPPEQILGQPLSNASDLYSLGATIICLVTGIKSTQLNTIIDSNFTINFKSKLSQYNRQFINWLERMVKPKMEERFPDAKQALNVLNSIDNLVSSPDIPYVCLSFEASQWKQKLTQIITINYSYGDTINWLIDDNDKSWIYVNQKKIIGNEIQFEVTVDTSELKCNETIERTISVEINGELTKYRIIVKTPSYPKEISNWCWLYLGLFFIFSFAWGGLILSLEDARDFAIYIGISGGISGAFSGVLFARNLGLKISSFIILSTVSLTIVAAIAGAIMDLSFQVIYGPIFWLFSCAILGVTSGTILTRIFLRMKKQGFYNEITDICILLTFISGASLGWLSLVGINVYTILALAGSSVPLASMLITSYKKRKKLIAEYRKKEPYLIEP